MLRAGGDDAAMVGPHDLAALSPDEAGRLVEDLAAADRVDEPWPWSSPRPHRTATRSSTLLRAAAALPAGCYARDVLVRAVALATSLRLRSALDEVGDDPTLADVLDAGGRRAYRAGRRAAVPLVAGARDGDGGTPWGRSG